MTTHAHALRSLVDELNISLAPLPPALRSTDGDPASIIVEHDDSISAALAAISGTSGWHQSSFAS